MKSGVYKITNTLDGKVYVGSSKRLSSRLSLHKRQLALGVHHSKKLQRAWDKYGPSSFEFSVIEYVELVDSLIAREQHWIDVLQAASKDGGYNIRHIADSNFGIKRSDEVRKAASLQRMGKKRGPQSDEHRSRIGQGNTGKTRSEETRRKISEAKIGVKLPPRSEESKAKMSATMQRKMSEEGYIYLPL